MILPSENIYSSKSTKGVFEKEKTKSLTSELA